MISIGENAFSKCSSLKKITIPEGVTSIGASAFYDCSSLTEITIPNSVTSIGASAFYDCSSLTEITIPNSVTSIENNTFYGCSSLTEITIPNSVTSIKNSTFYGCSSLTEITIPNSVTSIGQDAFYDCSSLTEITIPNSVTSIGAGAFSGCSSLTEITIPNNVTSIRNKMFYNCKSLTSVTMGYMVKEIGYNAFENCNKISSITCLSDIPPTVNRDFTSINTSTCKLYVPEKALTNYRTAPVWALFTTNIIGIDVEITTYMLNMDLEEGGSVTYNGNEYTTNCTIEVLPDVPIIINIKPNEGYIIGNVVFNGKDMTNQVDEDGNITLPELTENVTLQISFIKTYLLKLDIGNGGMVIYDNNEYTYEHNFVIEQDKTITLNIKPDKGYLIDSIIFNEQNMTDLVDEEGYITLPALNDNSIIQIDFKQAYMLNLNIGEGGTVIYGEETFKSNGKIEVEYNTTTTLNIKPDKGYIIDSVIFNDQDITENIDDDGNVTLPILTENSTVQINFRQAYLLNLNISEGGTVIYGEEIFKSNDKIEVEYNTKTTLNIKPDKGYLIDSIIFNEQNMTDLVDEEGYITLPALNDNALLQVSFKLSYIQIGDLIYRVKDQELKTLEVADCSEEITIISIQENVIYNGNIYYVTSIGDSAFYNCRSLTQVNIPNSVTNIGNQAFDSCNKINKMTIHATEPPILGYSVFDGVSRNIPVYVPDESLDLYRSAEVWNEFNLQGISTGIMTPSLPESITICSGIMQNPQALKIDIYDLQGRIIYSGNATTLTMTSGIYIIRCEKTCCKVIF